MPVNFLASVLRDGSSAIPYYDKLKFYVPITTAVLAVKYFFAGSSNTWDRDMHGRVVILTGGTSGVGAAVARDFAFKGAQLVLLVRSLDEWTLEYIEDLREESGNTLIYAEECNLADFMSVRKFATKWIDNSPPRRLDMVVCCAATATPPFVDRQATVDGLERMLQVNYLGHFHLLNILAPALRSQAPDRDVRVILTSCIASVMAVLDLEDLGMDSTLYDKRSPWHVLGASKLALSLLGVELQRQFNTYERKDKAPNNVHVAVVDPGMMRSPSFKRFFSCGSLLGLLLYLVLWPIWWLTLRNSAGGAQSLFHAAKNPAVGESSECVYISNATIRSLPPRKEFNDPEFQQKLFKQSVSLIEKAEKQTALERKKQEKHDKKAEKKSDKKSAKPGSKATAPATGATQQRSSSISSKRVPGEPDLFPTTKPSANGKKPQTAQDKAQLFEQAFEITAADEQRALDRVIKEVELAEKMKPKEQREAEQRAIEEDIKAELAKPSASTGVQKAQTTAFKKTLPNASKRRV